MPERRAAGAVGDAGGNASGVEVADVLAVGLVLRVPRSVLRGIAFARAGTEENG